VTINDNVSVLNLSALLYSSFPSCYFTRQVGTEEMRGGEFWGGLSFSGRLTELCNTVV